MAGLNLRKFLGIAPKVSPELLPDTSAQVARNTKLYSGDLIPMPKSVVVGNSGRASGTLTLYGIRDPDTDDIEWLTWNKQVDVATVTTEQGSEFRFFWTGDGVPKMSTFDLAVQGAPPYPKNSYSLGLPLPTTKLTTTITHFTSANVSSFSRDLNAVATLTTSAPHNLKNKALITVTGFTYYTGTYTISGTTVTINMPNHGLTGVVDVPLTFTSGGAVSGTYEATVVDANTFTIVDPSHPSGNGNVRWSMASFNTSSVTATVTSPTTLTYPSSAFPIATRTGQAGVVALGGPDVPRTYVYTWYNEYNEESIGSDPSALIFVKEGDTVTVQNIPSSFTDPQYRVNGVRLYRSAGSSTTSDYLLLHTLWFPKSVTDYARISGTATVGFSSRHEMIVGDRFRIQGMADATFNIMDAVVTAVPDPNHISYAAAGSDVLLTTAGAGTIYYDVSENPPTTTPRYWGWAGNYDFIDDFDPTNLTTTLSSDKYEVPPPALEGLITAQNGILAGFVGNTVYFSEPYKPHAWPSAYAVTLDYEVVSLALMSGTLVVLTTGYPFLISGNDPAALSTRRIDALYPCTNRKGVVSMNYGVVYPTHDGLAVISTQLSAQLATKVIFNIDTWHENLVPEEIVAEFYGDAYVASWSGGSFTFEPVLGGESVPPYFVDYDAIFSAAWYDPISGVLFYAQIDNASIYAWDPLHGVPSVMTWKSKVFKTPNMINLGAARVIADFPSADNLPVTFTLWADKRIVATVQVDNNGIFRLPSGYRTDTFEVAVAADIRIRAIHLAETPYALREV